MRPVATRLLSVVGRSRRALAIARDRAGQAAPPSITNDPRVGLKAGFRDAGARGARTWSWSRRCRSRTGSSIRRRRPGASDAARNRGGRGGRGGAGADAGTRRRATPPATPPPTPPRRRRPRRCRRRPRRRRRRAELRQLRPRVPPRRHVPRQLQRLQHLRHRDAEEAAAARLGRVPRRAGRHVGPRQPALHVGRADARPRRLRHAGRDRRRSSAERFRGVRIFDISDISKPKQVAAVQTCRGSHTHTLVTDPKDTANIYIYGSGTGAGPLGRGARRAARARRPKRTRTRRSSAST